MIRLLVTLATLAAVSATAAPLAGRIEVQAFIADMHARHDFEPEALNRLFEKTHSLPPVLRAIAPIAPAARSWHAYRARFIEPRRLGSGLNFWHKHRRMLVKAQAIYGVPEEIVVAIIGIETIYGRETGRFPAFAALATLAFDYPPRADLFRRELEALLLLARDERRDPLTYRASYAGALGLPQFLPSSVRDFAVDFDADGHIDLSRSAADAIGSVANFLHRHGWRQGGPIAVAAIVEGDPASLIAEGIRPRRLPEEMAPYGVRSDGAPNEPAALIDLATPGAATEYRLGFENFFVLTRYNRSSFYAATVLEFAQALRAGMRASASE